jgi:hypothetical protein
MDNFRLIYHLSKEKKEKNKLILKQKKIKNRLLIFFFFCLH